MSPEEDIQISIGKFSQITSLSQRALRLYEEKGLISPKRDRFNNYRFYTSDQIETGLKIKTLSWMGFSCAEIDQILAYLEDPAANEARIEQLFKQKLAQTQIEIQKLKKVEEVLQGRKAIEVLYMTSTEPVVKEIPEIRVISKRGAGEPSAVIPGLIGAVMQQIFSPANQRGNVNINGPITLLFNHEHADENARRGRHRPHGVRDRRPRRRPHLGRAGVRRQVAAGRKDGDAHLHWPVPRGRRGVHKGASNTSAATG